MVNWPVVTTFAIAIGIIFGLNYFKVFQTKIYFWISVSLGILLWLYLFIDALVMKEYRSGFFFIILLLPIVLIKYFQYRTILRIRNRR